MTEISQPVICPPRSSPLYCYLIEALLSWTFSIYWSFLLYLCIIWASFLSLDHYICVAALSGCWDDKRLSFSMPEHSQPSKTVSNAFKNDLWIFLVRLLKTMGNYWNKFLQILWRIKLFICFLLSYQTAALITLSNIFFPYTLLPLSPACLIRKTLERKHL